MEGIFQGLVSGFFFSLTVFIIKRDISRLSALVDRVAERQRQCREELPRQFVPAEFCREQREETDRQVGNLFGRVKEVEERTSRLGGLMSARERGGA